MGLKSHHTLWLVCFYKGKLFSLLFNNGSTHDFLDENYDLYQTIPFMVTVVNGEHLCSPLSIPKFSWQM